MTTIFLLTNTNTFSNPSVVEWLPYIYSTYIYASCNDTSNTIFLCKNDRTQTRIGSCLKRQERSMRVDWMFEGGGGDVQLMLAESSVDCGDASIVEPRCTYTTYVYVRGPFGR